MAGTAIESPAVARELLRSDFEYALPPELIAQQPSARREDARLLIVRGHGLRDRRIADLAECLDPGDLLVLNDTRVVKARLFGEKGSGGRVEALVERVLDPQRALLQIRTSHTPKPGTVLHFGRPPVCDAEVLGRVGEFFDLRFSRPVDEVLALAGSVPLPPYIHHAPDAADESRYQTVYACRPGAVAAPTAGLHLSQELLARLDERGVRTASVTLHVGAGTFQPVRTLKLSEHRMHREAYRLPQATVDAVQAARARGGRVVAVGTTSVRVLESCMREGHLAAGEGDTALFITPGFRFQCVDRLLTNFHLPGSTLLMLVSAFAGMESIRQAYAHAIAQRYRFFSYGDAMLLDRADSRCP
jgi:S-adenosylmethionine:tRNA ribosyltransferase-isomerase